MYACLLSLRASLRTSVFVVGQSQKRRVIQKRGTGEENFSFCDVNLFLDIFSFLPLRVETPENYLSI